MPQVVYALNKPQFASQPFLPRMDALVPRESRFTSDVRSPNHSGVGNQGSRCVSEPGLCNLIADVRAS